MPDYEHMECERFREMLSAQLDGEDAPGERDATDAHLVGCASCRAWLDDAAALNRLARTWVATTTPGRDLTDTVLAAAPPPPRQRRQPRLVGALRLLLGVLSGVQILLGLAQITATATARAEHLHPAAAGAAGADHLWHESAAWNVAVGAGFLWIALRRGRPVGMLPTLTAFIAVLTLLTANDVVVATVDLNRILSHGFIITGYIVVVLLTRVGRDTDTPPAGRHGRPDWQTEPADTTTNPIPAPRPGLRLLPGPPSASQSKTHRRAA
jgi:predicted anti-sigma-YlaC factor YlaD